MEKGNYPLALEAFEAAATLEPSFAEVGGVVVVGHVLGQELVCQCAGVCVHELAVGRRWVVCDSSVCLSLCS